MARSPSEMGRRIFLSGTAAAVGGAVVAGGTRTAGAVVPLDTVPPEITVTPSDRRYPDLVVGQNNRWVAKPEAVRLVSSTEQVVAAVQDAVRSGKRITVRSGGHCFEDFVYNAETQLVLDLSNLNEIGFDAGRGAAFAQPGAILLDAYEKLYSLWGVTVPGGICYSVGFGGHVAGGGWGMLCRQLGLISDYLEAVEVVVVDVDGGVRSVVATRDHDDPNHDLWWAHTGGGGGNFGVVTKYWFRTPGAVGQNPADLLPKPPASVLLSAVSFPWEGLTQGRFTTLLRNFGAWHVANNAPDNPTRALCSFMPVNHRSNGQIGLVTQVDATAPNARQMLADYLAAISRGVGVPAGALTNAMGEFAAMPELATPRHLPWLRATRFLGTSNPTLTDPTLRGDYKSSYMRANFPDSQVAALYKHLTRPDIDNPTASVLLSSFGGRVNAVAPRDTAFAHRDAAFKMVWNVMWNDPADDATYVGWTRESYGEVYADTGGVPVPNAVTDGCYVNYPDNDLNDPALNTSPVAWHTLYYGDNYPRLQQVKLRWDPRNIFRHTQSVRLPGT